MEAAAAAVEATAEVWNAGWYAPRGGGGEVGGRRAGRRCFLLAAERFHLCPIVVHLALGCF